MNVRDGLIGAAIGLLAAVPAAAQDEAADAGTVVATVGGTEITLGHMIALRERLPEQYRQLPDDALFDGVLQQLINQEALSQAADETSPRTELVIENERRALRANSVLQGVAEDAVSDEAIEQAYEETYGDAEPTTEWNAAHILLETEEAANEIKAALDDGADFAELARERSTGPSGPNGGDLGWFGPGMMVPKFEETVSGLEPGSVSEPFQTQFGWHVARLNEVREAEPPALEEVRPQLVEQVQQQAIEARVESVTEGVEVVREDPSAIDPSLLSDTSLID
jgi:peptidyl-prolyl cis-trans isomerase C